MANDTLPGDRPRPERTEPAVKHGQSGRVDMGDGHLLQAPVRTSSSRPGRCADPGPHGSVRRCHAVAASVLRSSGTRPMRRLNEAAKPHRASIRRISCRVTTRSR
jgi:hypothetical protein